MTMLDDEGLLVMQKRRTFETTLSEGAEGVGYPRSMAGLTFPGACAR